MEEKLEVEKRLGKIKSMNICTKTYVATAVPDNSLATALVLKLQIGGKGWGTDLEYAVAAESELSGNLNVKNDVEKIITWLKDAGANSINDLENVPIEAEIANNTVLTFRILTEVL